MKKISFILLFTAAIIGFNSCEYKGEPCKFNKKSIYLPVEQKMWQFDSIARQFYVHYDITDITKDVYDYGDYSLHREFNTGKKNAYQVALPMSQFRTDTLTDPTVVYYTQYIDFRIGIGFVEIQVTNSDYLYTQENPETMYFRLQANSTILDLTIAQADWQFDQQTQQYYYHFNLSEITADIYDNGHWTISREYNKGTTEAYQVALPMSCYMTDTLYNNPVVYYEEHIDYRVGVGYVEIQLTNSDHLYLQDLSGEFIKPEDMMFHLQLTY